MPQRSQASIILMKMAVVDDVVSSSEKQMYVDAFSVKQQQPEEVYISNDLIKALALL